MISGHWVTSLERDTRKQWKFWKEPFVIWKFVNGISVRSISHSLKECEKNFKELSEEAWTLNN